MIVLTGASGGIGTHLIPHLLKLDSVIGIYNSRSISENAVDSLTYERVNLLNAESIGKFVSEHRIRLSRVTIVHLAVVNIDGLAARYAEENWDHVMGVNLKGAFLLNRAILPLMMSQSWGRIIHISSYVGLHGNVGTVAYSVSKTGILGMSRTLAREYGRFGITANTLALGYFDVGLINSLTEVQKSKISSQIPSGKFGSVVDIAEGIRFLIAASYVNGAEIRIDGGL